MEGHVSSLGERILLLRRRAGWTQSQLSDVSGIPISIIARVERGIVHELKSGILCRLADTFEVTTDSLLGRLSEEEQAR